MKRIPQEVVSFYNDLYAEVNTDKKLIQTFLKKGTVLHELTKELEEKDAKESLQNPTRTLPDGSEEISFLLHGCKGVFTDERNLVYFWRLSSPAILEITSQKYESAFIYLKDPPMKHIKSLNR